MGTVKFLDLNKVAFLFGVLIQLTFRSKTAVSPRFPSFAVNIFLGFLENTAIVTDCLQIGI